MPERESIIARIRQIRRSAEAAAGETRDPRSTQDVIRALEARVEHLEQQLQGLQDSVHREARRQGSRIAELEARIEPAEIGRALNREARDRGL